MVSLHMRNPHDYHMCDNSGYVVDHFNENTLIYGVLSFVALALISTFTFAKGLNNPKVTCEN